MPFLSLVTLTFDFQTMAGEPGLEDKRATTISSSLCIGCWQWLDNIKKLCAGTSGLPSSHWRP